MCNICELNKFNMSVKICRKIKELKTNIILTNTDDSNYKIIDVWNLPNVKLIECFKN
jgi:hypothetical protein